MKLYFWGSCWQKIQLSSIPSFFPPFCLCLIFVASLCSHSACQHYPRARARMLTHGHYLIHTHTCPGKNKLKKNRANERQLWVLADTMSSSYCKRNVFLYTFSESQWGSECHHSCTADRTGNDLSRYFFFLHCQLDSDCKTFENMSTIKLAEQCCESWLLWQAERVSN